MYIRGSEWRRWDLHVHTPETKKNDNYEGCTIEEKWNLFYDAIDKYVNTDDARKKVAVVGITDYLSIDNYLKVVSEKRLPSCIENIFPNVEMRITPMGQNSPVNIHFIFNPEIVGELEERFFSKLVFKYGERKFSATKRGLIALGKELGCSNEEEAYKNGLEQYIPTYSDICQLFDDDLGLRENTLIGVSNKSTDGASGINRGEGGDQLTATRTAVYKLCDFIFSSNQNDIAYFLGEGIDNKDTVIKKYDSLKPCFHGSDAHCIEKLFEPDNEKYCWIKADPTFNGLKQVVYEPAARVRIGSLKPEMKADYQVIDSVVIDDENFAPSPIEFNDKLTCIIGGKSTGKSLLLQNIARTIDEKQVDKKLEVSGVSSKIVNKMIVRWRDGDDSANGKFDQTHKIVYIPQTYLNRLTDNKEQTTEIDKIIQDIVLLDQNCKLAFEKMENSLKVYKPELDKKIYDLLHSYDEMTGLIQERNEIGTEAGIKKEIEKYKVQKESISKELAISETELAEYDKAIKTISECNKIIAICDNDIKSLKGMDVLVSKISISSDFSEDIYQKVEEFQKLMIDDVNSKWEVKKGELATNILIKKTDTETKKKHAQEICDKLSQKVQESEALGKLSAQIKTEEDKLSKVIEFTKKVTAKKVEYESFLDDISGALMSYKEIQKNYADIINSNASINTDGLYFSVMVQFTSDAFTSMMRTVINNNSLKKLGLNYEEKLSDEELTKEKLKNIISQIVNDDIKLLKGNSKEHVLREILSNWYIISYNVKMENDMISEMSPGKKALVLLKLLISMADSKCPILIDQPEDDLDNRSIFDELIPFIREKKVTRQIIIVTHNANVVLGGDAEEIIVANQSGNNSPNEKYRFEYRSGAIENDTPVTDDRGNVMAGILNKKGIQHHICDILEGGKAAFDLRKNKYRI